jgi:hypothetical protein
MPARRSLMPELAPLEAPRNNISSSAQYNTTNSPHNPLAVFNHGDRTQDLG